MAKSSAAANARLRQRADLPHRMFIRNRRVEAEFVTVRNGYHARRRVMQHCLPEAAVASPTLPLDQMSEIAPFERHSQLNSSVFSGLGIADLRRLRLVNGSHDRMPQILTWQLHAARASQWYSRPGVHM